MGGSPMRIPLRFVLLLFLIATTIWALQQFNRTRSAVTSADPPASVPVTTQAAPEEEQGFRILLGLTDTNSELWDGSLTVASGALARIEPWRFDMQDAFVEKTETSASWRLSTHPMRAFGGGQQAPQQRIVANGVIATLSRLNSSTEVTIKTAQGNFTFKPAETGY